MTNDIALAGEAYIALLACEERLGPARDPVSVQRSQLAEHPGYFVWARRLDDTVVAAKAEKFEDALREFEDKWHYRDGKQGLIEAKQWANKWKCAVTAYDAIKFYKVDLNDDSISSKHWFPK